MNNTNAYSTTDNANIQMLIANTNDTSAKANYSNANYRTITGNVNMLKLMF